jgi:hypothetical protein
MNVVLQQLIPGLTIKVKTLGIQLLEDGEQGIRIQLIPSRGERDILLNY